MRRVGTRLGNKQESVLDRARSGRAKVRESGLLLLFAYERSLWLQAWGEGRAEIGEKR